MPHRDHLASGSKSSSGSLTSKKTSKNNVGQFMNLFPSSASSSSSPRSEKIQKSSKLEKKSSKQLNSARTTSTRNKSSSSSGSDSSDSSSMELFVANTRHRQSPTIIRKKQGKMSEKSKSVDKTDSEKVLFYSSLFVEHSF
jgi:hypothetical protein